MDNLNLLEQVVSEGQKIMDGVKADQLTASTPCEEFDVKTLINHVTMAAVLITDGVHQKPMNPDLFTKDFVGDDGAAAFREGSKQLTEAWTEQGGKEGTVIMPFGETPAPAGLSFTIVEMYTHISDTAVATEQEDALDPVVANHVLHLVQDMPIDNFRMPGVFGPEVPCDESAPAHRRMLAVMGRKV